MASNTAKRVRRSCGFEMGIIIKKVEILQGLEKFGITDLLLLNVNYPIFSLHFTTVLAFFPAICLTTISSKHGSFDHYLLSFNLHVFGTNL